MSAYYDSIETFSLKSSRQYFWLEAASTQTCRLKAVLQHVRVDALDQHLVRLVHCQNNEGVVFTRHHLQQVQVRELRASIRDVYQITDMPSLRVHHMHTIWLPKEHNRVLTWVEARHELQTCDTQGSATCPRPHTCFLSLAIDESELLSIVLEGDYTSTVDEQVIDNFSNKV